MAVVLVIHLILALAIIGLVLLQRSEGGGLGMGGGSMGGLTTAQGAASALSRATAWCVAGFFVTSLTLGVMSGQGSRGGSIMDRLDQPVAANEATLDGDTATDAVPDAPAAEDTPDTPAAPPEAPVAE